MKTARLVVLGVAVAAGGIAALLVARSHQPAPSKPTIVATPRPLFETVEVLIAKTDLQRGQMIGSRDVGWQAWPKDAANARFITKAARPDAPKVFAGAIVRVPVAAGQPIYDPMVVFAKGSGFLAAILPKGMRAVAIEVAPVSGAGGFILPGDHVDILLTRAEAAAPQAGGMQKYFSDIILQNVTVLAVDQTAEEKHGAKVIVGRTATLELTPQQAEVLARSSRQGTVSLALRSLRDSQSPLPESVENWDGTRTSINLVRYGVSALTLR